MIYVVRTVSLVISIPGASLSKAQMIAPCGVVGVMVAVTSSSLGFQIGSLVLLTGWGVALQSILLIILVCCSLGGDFLGPDSSEVSGSGLLLQRSFSKDFT